MSISADLSNVPVVLRRYFSAAFEVGRAARWNSAPVLVDLVAGGWRNILCDQPDVVYSIGALNIARGRAYRLRIPPSAAVYSIVTVSNREGQAFWDAVHDPGQSEPIEIPISDGGTRGVDTSAHEGLCLLIVRQYFRAPVDRSRYADHRPSLDLLMKETRPRRRLLPVSLVAGIAFLLPRLYSLLQARIRGPRLGLNTFRAAPVRRSKSEFLSSGRYLVLRFVLNDGQMLRVDYDSGNSIWFAFSVSNYYLENIAHINSCQLSRNPDGTYTILLRADRPQRTNDLSSAGLRDGILMLREVRATPDALTPQCRTVPAPGEDAGPTSAGEFDACLGDG